MNGEELYDWMAVLNCKHVARLCQMPASMGDVACARLVGHEITCGECSYRPTHHKGLPLGYRAAVREVKRTVTRAGLWDWAVCEQLRDERWADEHARSLSHAMGACVCGAKAQERAGELGREHGTSGRSPFMDERCELDESALMDALGETSPTTELNAPYRLALIEAYLGALEAAALPVTGPATRVYGDPREIFGR